MNPVVNFRSAVCVLNDFPVLVDVDLEVAAGEVVAVRGTNGAGKTTLLRVAAGLVGLRSGSCQVFGADVEKHKRAVRSKLSYAGHSPALYDELTLAENVEFAIACSSASGGARNVHIDELMSSVGLSVAAQNVLAKRASSGQRRRASLAMVAARDCPLWILDEPMSGLDRDGKDLVTALVAAAKSEGKTILVTTHDNNLQSVADREVEVCGGSIRPVIEVSRPEAGLIHV